MTVWAVYAAFSYGTIRSEHLDLLCASKEYAEKYVEVMDWTNGGIGWKHRIEAMEVRSKEPRVSVLRSDIEAALACVDDPAGYADAHLDALRRLVDALE